MTRNSRWADVPETVKVRMRESMRARQVEKQWRKAERQRLGIGRNKTALVRIHAKSLDRLRACAFMTQALATIQGVEPEWVAHRFSMAEELRRQINLAFERLTKQLEYLASEAAGSDGRPEMALEKAHRLDAGWK